MKKHFFITISIFSLLIPCKIFATEYYYILNDKCVEDLFSQASAFFEKTNILPIKDSRGIILRYFFENAIEEYRQPNIEVYKKLEKFLAKIENPAIIEVHIYNFLEEENFNIKKWELSTIIGNYIEDTVTEPLGLIPQERINSIGYGEFLPAKNTSNNGGKNSNRIDIIILCNISGE